MFEHGYTPTLQPPVRFSLILLFFSLLLFANVRTLKAAESGSLAATFPDDGAYCGAYIDFGEAEDKVTLEAIEKFEKMVGKRHAIIASSSFWGELSFPGKNVRLIFRHGALPLIFWSPWDRPYAERGQPDRFNLKEILLGKWDAYIDQWAVAAKESNIPMLVSWGLEMNGDWFPWAGSHYGGGKNSKSGFEGPKTFKKAFRYVVDRVRARGANNILWGFHVNHFTYPQDAWNRMSEYYPGADYVDWFGLSVYGKQFLRDGDWSSFKDVMEEGYQELCRIDPVKPVLVAEYGVGEFPSLGNKAEWITGALELLRTRYTRVKGAVYWHERWPNEDGTYSNLRINSSPEALAAYRNGIANPFWLDRPQYIPRKPDLSGRLTP
jgi:hypothetical protein